MNYGEAEKKVIGLKQKIEESKGRRIETERRVQESESYLSSLSERFKATVLDGRDGRSDELKKIETEVQKNQTTLTRDRALVEGLTSEIPRLEDELRNAEAERARLFTEQAGKWLRGTVKEYDQAVESLRAVVGRLLACASILHEAGELQTYLASVGGEDIGNLIRDLKIPKIAGFNISAWRENRPFIFADVFKAAVEAEIAREGR